MTKTDTTHFDGGPLEEPPEKEDTSGWDTHFGQVTTVEEARYLAAKEMKFLKKTSSSALLEQR